MPRIRCPNCGATINLEERRELDYKIILSSMQTGSRTFTDLLKSTGLPRKTLSLRLTTLCNSGLIVKDGGYRLNAVTNLGKWGKKMVLVDGRPLLLKPSIFTRRNVLLILMLLVIGIPIATNVLAMINPPPPPPPPQPSYIGTLKVDINVYNSTDLFAWQAMIKFNSSELVYIEAVEGNFLKARAPYGTLFLNASDIAPGKLLVFGTQYGRYNVDVPGVSGTGTLATITFGYKSETYELPKIVYESGFETFLFDSNLKYTEGMLALELTEG